MSQWDEIVGQLAPQVVKIETQAGWGTGFIVYGDVESWVRTIATAYHVIEKGFGKPFNIISNERSFKFGKPDKKDVVIARVDDLDAATLILAHRDLPMPVIPLLERETALAIGMEIGWLGYPHIAEGLCFFSGRISGIADDDHFLVDGTSIHGVSGGPAFCITPNGPRIVGSITGYRPNPVGDGYFPGLSFVTHVAAHRAIDIEMGPDNTFSVINRSDLT